jgi:hypothetical protein
MEGHSQTLHKTTFCHHGSWLRTALGHSETNKDFYVYLVGMGKA